MVLSTTTFVDSVQSNRMLIREWTRINKLVLSTTTFVDSVQSNRMLIREWTRIDKLCRPKQEKQQIIRWDTSSHINKFVDQQDGSNNQIVVSVPTSTSGVVPNRQNAARQLYPIKPQNWLRMVDSTIFFYFYFLFSLLCFDFLHEPEVAKLSVSLFRS